jgi:hypothetical protein
VDGVPHVPTLAPPLDMAGVRRGRRSSHSTAFASIRNDEPVRSEPVCLAATLDPRRHGERATAVRAGVKMSFWEAANVIHHIVKPPPREV